MSKAIEILLYVQGVILALAAIGNGTAKLLRVLNQPSAAAKVDQITPFAMRLGMAKTAREAVDTVIEPAHVITTSPPNEGEALTKSGGAVVTVELTPVAPESASPPPASKAPSGLATLCLGMLFALVAFGCGAAEKVQRVVQMSSEVIVRAEPCLVVQYEMQQEDCLKLEPVDEARACVDRVKATWKPIVDALVELRTVRCEIEPEKCEAKEN